MEEIFKGIFPVKALKPTGAGDAFMAGFVGALFKHIDYKKIFDINTSTHHKELESSLKIANVCGALTCTSRGDTASMPTMNEALKIIEENKILQ